MKTKYKFFFAKFIYLFLKIFFKKKFIIVRNKINWNIDISEAVDLYLFLFGSFEREIFEAAKKLNLNNYGCILDIGANFGVQSLQFARVFPNSKIYSFEPTNYAYKKMLKNLTINKSLKKKILPIQAFVSNQKAKKPKEVYSSWNLKTIKKKHGKHMGIKKSISLSKVVRLDRFILQKGIRNIDFIKIDVDGSELYVLMSGKKFLKKKNPIIFMEWAPYLNRENGYSIKELIACIRSLGYSFYNIRSTKKISNIEKFSKKIKDGSSTNVLLMK